MQWVTHTVPVHRKQQKSHRLSFNVLLNINHLFIWFSASSFLDLMTDSTISRGEVKPPSVTNSLQPVMLIGTMSYCTVLHLRLACLISIAYIIASGTGQQRPDENARTKYVSVCVWTTKADECARRIGLSCTQVGNVYCTIYAWLSLPLETGISERAKRYRAICKLFSIFDRPIWESLPIHRNQWRWSVINVGGPGLRPHLSLRQSSFFPSLSWTPLQGLGRIRSPAVKHFDAIYAVIICRQWLNSACTMISVPLVVH